MKKIFRTLALVLGLVVGSHAKAGIPVLDAANLANSVQQVIAWGQQYQQMIQQLTELRNQYAQLQTTYQSMTGGRGLATLLNGVADQLTVLVGDLSDKASGTYDIITANIVANAILSLAPAVPGLMAEDAVFIASGIIDSRKDEVIAGLEAAGLAVQEVKEKRGWECIVCRRK